MYVAVCWLQFTNYSDWLTLEDFVLRIFASFLFSKMQNLILFLLTTVDSYQYSFVSDLSNAIQEKDGWESMGKYYLKLIYLVRCLVGFITQICNI